MSRAYCEINATTSARRTDSLRRGSSRATRRFLLSSIKCISCEVRTNRALSPAGMSKCCRCNAWRTECPRSEYMYGKTFLSKIRRSLFHGENLPLTCGAPIFAACAANSANRGCVKNRNSASAGDIRINAEANCIDTCPSPVAALRMRPLSIKIRIPPLYRKLHFRHSRKKLPNGEFAV